ncbi:ATP-binding protein [Falsibacillus pallidus]|uniref:histidine kinase n=1 Tax=Falsibacillus pallidus TaxID=493781 RepID=A0A370GQN0_9BACI|nr:ATP-binding protein [Falsibacillus pallidus]RDI45620.1 two-component system sporulation sensor kinase B [Falsibacillus pallidus]
MDFNFPSIVNQLLIVLFPMLIYHLFFHEKSIDRKRIKSKLTFILLVMIVLTMTFPIEIEKGYLYDFRVIPYFIAFFYCGRMPGMLIFMTMLAYRFFLGGTGFYVILLSYSLSTALLWFISVKYEGFTLRAKVMLVSLCYWIKTIMMSSTLLLIGRTEQIHFMILFYLTSWISLIIVVFIIENVNQQNAINEEMQHAEKLNIISQLAASVAHEVRNPMTSVNGFLQLMKDDDNLKDSQRHYISIALNELNHAQSIINDYLSLAKPSSEGLSTINVSEEVEKTIELMKSYSNIQNIHIETEIEDDLYMKGNKGEVKQILVNIMKNGIEAMDNGGTLKVQVFNKHGAAMIEISDSGKGMTHTQLKKLGVPFYTTKEKGTGVGMTITFQLVHAMKGKIDVESEPGKGTSIRIKFPLAA